MIEALFDFLWPIALGSTGGAAIGAHVVRRRRRRHDSHAEAMTIALDEMFDGLASQSSLPIMLPTLAAQGWTPDTIDALKPMVQAHPDRTDLLFWFVAISHRIGSGRWPGRTATDQVRWVAAFGSDPARLAQGADPEEEARRYVKAVGRRLAPLAWAAGLSAEEAGQQQRAGTLDEPTLVTMAALRGAIVPTGIR